MLHAAALGCRWMVEDILTAAEVEHALVEEVPRPH
jgi:hypothetical protein